MRFWYMVPLLFPLVCPAQTVIFSESGRAEATIEQHVNKATQSVWLAMYQFTDVRLMVALTNRACKGVDVWIVADASESLSPHSCVPALRQTLKSIYGVDRVKSMYGRDGKYSIMHDKFCVIDGREVITGSYNWTARADQANWENLLLSSARGVVSQYAKEFQVLWSR